MTVEEFRKLKTQKPPKKNKTETAAFEMWAKKQNLTFEKEVRFAPPRRWKADFLFTQNSKQIAVEIEGGVHSSGRHTRGVGFEKDMEKYNTYTYLGIYLLRFTTAQIEKEPAKCADFIKKCFLVK
mgnify:CR=1 FL=1